MPNKRHNSTKRRRKPQSSSTQIMRSGFKQLLEAQIQQEVRFKPELADVPRIRFKDNIINIELSYYNTITSSTTVSSSAGLSFSLSVIANQASYANIFDLYRILQVNVKFIPTQTSTTSGQQGVGGTLYTVIDYDDSNTPTNLSSLFEYKTLKIAPPGVIDERTLSPRIAVAAYSGTFTSYANASNKTWIDTASPSVAYYGLKYYLTPTPTVQTINYVITLMVQFKNQKQS